jgi:HKD family nuclease
MQSGVVGRDGRYSGERLRGLDAGLAAAPLFVENGLDNGGRMATATVFFGEPQREVATRIRSWIAQADSVAIAVGFATVDGLEAIAPPIRQNPGRLEAIVLGACTFRGFQTLDTLLAAGVVPDRVRVHLGHTRLSTSARAKSPFYKYHPMLHSKVYLFRGPGGARRAFIGSHNMTAFALMGLNGEAGVLVEGTAADPEFQKIEQHIAEARRQSVQYTEDMKDAYAWWTAEAIEGLLQQTRGDSDDAENKTTFVILAESSGTTPDSGEIVYFELPAAAQSQITRTGTEVHLFVFNKLPDTPLVALAQLDSAVASYWCTTEGIERDRGGRELRVDWLIESRQKPVLSRAPARFRPDPAEGDRQIRVKTRNEVFKRYEYLFSRRRKWLPVLDEQQTLALPESELGLIRSLELIPPHDRPWPRVVGLVPDDEPTDAVPTVEVAVGKARRGAKTAPRGDLVLRELSPAAGAYVLMSPRRREPPPPAAKPHDPKKSRR